MSVRLFIATFIFAMWFSPALAVSGAELAELCGVTKGRTTNTFACSAFIYGVIDGVSWERIKGAIQKYPLKEGEEPFVTELREAATQVACPPDDATASGYVAAVREHLGENRPRWHFPAAHFIYLAVTTAYPCFLSGTIVTVADGKNLTILAAAPYQERQYVVRLIDIEAPERGQRFYSESWDSLIELCRGKAAAVTSSKQDKSGRLLGRVICAGKDAATEQVRRGMAWVADRYVGPPAFHPPLDQLQREARAAKRGLWSDINAVPPSMRREGP